ncbi:MAG TPA: polysaccharide lyase beta-sandwich domain-containing protein, partial [Opitutaceae bacterium]
GRLEAINPSRVHAGDPNDPIALEVFSLWFDHGTGPQDASYAYVILPGSSEPETAEFAARPPSAVVANDREQQAVFDARLRTGAAAFYSPGAVDLEPGLTVAVDQPCLLLYRELPDGAVRLAVANPENAGLTVNVALTRRLEGEACQWDAARGRTDVAFLLPGSPADAGRSVIRDFKARE